MFRKISKLENGSITNPSKKELHKQVTTLHKKIQKKDMDVVTEYVIERDNHLKKYHTHLLIHYNDEPNLKNQLQRFIGGSEWEDKMVGLNKVQSCEGKYGEVGIVHIYDETKYRNYMNKSVTSKTLI
jgi:hypothetical protein